jgi:hypothetical protein
MRTDSVLLCEAEDVLIRALGAVNMERFICMVKRDAFDYI